MSWVTTVTMIALGYNYKYRRDSNAMELHLCSFVVP